MRAFSRLIITYATPAITSNRITTATTRPAPPRFGWPAAAPGSGANGVICTASRVGGWRRSESPGGAGAAVDGSDGAGAALAGGLNTGGGVLVSALSARAPGRGASAVGPGVAPSGRRLPSRSAAQL